MHLVSPSVSVLLESVVIGCSGWQLWLPVLLKVLIHLEVPAVLGCNCEGV